jgi:hypothetical protein
VGADCGLRARARIVGDTCKMGGKHKMCEDCGAKQAAYGTVSEQKKRWCSTCSKGHGDVVCLTSACKDCGAKHATYGTVGERKKRWCSPCGKGNGHGDVVDLKSAMCEDCGAHTLCAATN